MKISCPYGKRFLQELRIASGSLRAVVRVMDAGEGEGNDGEGGNEGDGNADNGGESGNDSASGAVTCAILAKSIKKKNDKQ